MPLDWSTDKTPKSILVEEYYAKTGMDKGWPIERFHQLCHKLNCVPLDLGRLWLIKPHRIHTYLKTNTLTPEFSLRMAFMEDAFNRFVLKPPVPAKAPLFPFHVFFNPNDTRITNGS